MHRQLHQLIDRNFAGYILQGSENRSTKQHSLLREVHQNHLVKITQCGYRLICLDYQNNFV